MMPNDRSGRGGVIRGAIVGVVAIVLVVFAAMTWGPFAASSATITPGPSTAVIVPGGSPSPAPVASGDPASSPSSAPSAPASGEASPPPSASPAASGTLPPAALAAKLQRTLNALRAKLQIPGVSAAIVWDDGTTWVGASGLRNVATKDPMTTDTAFAYASISKTFTAAVVLELVQEGKIALDQSVAPFLPQFKLDKRITVRMLLDHTSGLRDYFQSKGIDAALLRAPNATWTAMQAWAFLPKPNAPPGKYFMYSNTNYMLLGELVTAITGQPLADEIRTRLLDPLGITGAYYQGVEAPKEPGTVAYRMIWTSSGIWRVVPVVKASDLMPFRSVVTAADGAGSLAGTALDAAKWMQLWAGGKVLDPALEKQVFADFANVAKLRAPSKYGLGMRSTRINGYKAYGHSGRYLGIQNVAWRVPELGLTVVVLTNQSIWDPNRFASALLRVLAPPKAPASSSSASPSPSPSAPG